MFPILVGPHRTPARVHTRWQIIACYGRARQSYAASK